MSQQGTVKKVIADKGFGFIEPDGGSSDKDLFFHASAMVEATFEEVQQDARVEYEVGQGPKGPRAENVRLL